MDLKAYYFLPPKGTNQILRVMRLTAFIILTACLQVSANSYSQDITITGKNVSLQKIFGEIRKQTGYFFWYDLREIEQAKPVTISVRNASLEKTLSLCLANQPLTYSIVDKTIVIKLKENNHLPLSNLVNLPPLPVIIRGTVLNDRGEPLSGASVLVKNSSTGTQTNADGVFSIDAPPNSTLVISYVGYIQQEITIGGSQQTLNITLLPLEDNKEEIVVIAYGTARKRDLTGAVSQVKSREITSLPANNVMQALQGRAAGVQILRNNGEPGGGISVRIRGTNSILGSNEPLYVIDGFPYSGNPTFLQNNDIESIEVLKDASSIAIYGSRGANGVVLITTKTGKKGGVTTVDVESGYSVQSVTKKMNLLTPLQYAELYNEQAANDGLAPYFTQQQIDSFSTMKGTDWQDLVMQRAPMYVNNVTVNGGNDKTRFSLSAGVFQQDGIIRNSDFRRYSLRGNFNHDISKIFNISYNATLTRINRQFQNSSLGNRGSDLISGMLMAPSTLSPYLEDGSYRRLTTAYPFISNALVNPLIAINEISNKIKADRVFSNVALTIKPMKDLSIRISGGIENTNDRSDYHANIEPSINSVGSVSIGTAQLTSLLNENVVNYSKQIGDRHHIAATAGFTYQDLVSTSVGGSGVGYLSDVTGTGSLSAAATPGIPYSGYSKWVLLSYLGRINYNLDDKYLLTLSIRRDGSSRYSPENKWSNFPSAAIAWRISNEPFLKASNTISDLKLRLSYGSTGSTAIGPYQTLNQLNPGNTIFGDALYLTYAPGSVLPGSLKWETTDQFDAGIDAAFLSNRIRITADYYIKRTKNLLNRVQLPASTGYSTTVQNVGEIENKGFEFMVDADVLRSEVNWNLSANISLNRNKVVKLYNGQDIFGSTFYTGSLNDYVNLLREGQPLGIFYGYIEKGYKENGLLDYEDLNGDGSINASDKTYIGNPNPDFIYGINSITSYLGFELTLFVQGSQGNDIFNLNKASTLDLGMGLNLPQEVYWDHWTTSKTNTTYPKITNKLNANMSTRFVEDGSYLRFRNIQLAYNLPVDQWNMKWFRNAQVYVSGQNLITLTSYSWYDPEVNAYGGSNSINQGIDYTTYPPSKSITFGIRCGF